MLLGTMAVYFVLILAIGVLAQRRTRDDADFMLAGRKTGALVAAVGAAASSSSAWSLLGVSGAAYAWGMSSLWLFPSCVGGFALNWYVMAPALRDHGHAEDAVSVPDILSRGARTPGIRRLASVVILVCMGAYVASQYQGAGKTFHAVFGVPTEAAVLVGAGAVFGYTMLGGFLAVSLTDTLQGLVMAATAVVLPAAALVHVGGLGGLAEGLRGVQEAGYMSIGGPRPAIIGLGFGLGILGIGLGYTGQPHVVKYFLAMDRGARTVVHGRRISLVWATVNYGGMILLGLCGRAMFPDLADKETVLVEAAQALFHPAIAGVMLAAVLSAIMSTADSQLLVASGTVTSDLGLGGRFGEARRLWVVRATVLVLTIFAAFAALVGTEEIFSRVLFGWAAMGAGFGPLLIVRVVLKRHLSPGWTFLLIALGSGLAAFSHTFYTDLLGTSALRSMFVHVVAFTLTLILAFAASRRPSV